jgi:hypothetical protein
MKNFRMFMMTAAVSLSAAAVFNSCSNDDEFSIPNDNSGIAGMYRISSFNVPATDLNADGTASTNLLSETDCYNSNLVKLNKNHTYAMTDNYVDASSGAQVCTEYAETGVWKRDGDVVTLTSSESNGYTSHDTALTYSEGAGTLTNAQTEGIYPGFDAFGNLIDATGEISYVYTKQAE